MYINSDEEVSAIILCTTNRSKKETITNTWESLLMKTSTTIFTGVKCQQPDIYLETI